MILVCIPAFSFCRPLSNIYWMYTDLSPSLFKALGEPLGKGEFNIEWQFMAKGWSP